MAEAALLLALFRCQLAIPLCKSTAELEAFEGFRYRGTPRVGAATVVHTVLDLALVLPFSLALALAVACGRGGCTARVVKVPAGATVRGVRSDLGLTVLYRAVSREDPLNGIGEVGELAPWVVVLKAFELIKVCLQLLGVPEDVGECCYLSRSPMSRGIACSLISQWQ